MNARGRNNDVIGFTIVLGLAMSLLLPMTAMGAGLPGYSDLTGSADPVPGWTDLFDENGKVKDLLGGHRAAFIEDNISAGVATDMSMLISADYVDNGTVQAINDLGNAYVYRFTDLADNLVLFVGVERLDVLADTFVEFEFIQDIIKFTHGRPWPIHGARDNGDLLIRMNFTAGAINSVEFKRWTTQGYETFESATPIIVEGCFSADGLYAYCSAPPIAGLAPANPEVWDMNFNPVSVPEPNNFIQVGVNVGSLLGANVDFSSILMRTPEDMILGHFQ